MKKYCRLITILLAFAMCTSLLHVKIYADDDFATIEENEAIDYVEAEEDQTAAPTEKTESENALELSEAIEPEIEQPDVQEQTEESSKEDTEEKELLKEEALTEVTVDWAEEKVEEIIPSGDDNDDRFAGFVDQTFGITDDSAFRKGAKGVSAGSRLSGFNRVLYNCLAPRISQIAAGSLSSTVFELSLEELGIAGLTGTGATSTEAYESLSAAFSELYPEQYSMGIVIDALLADYPYELFWYDKTRSTSSRGPGAGASGSDDGWVASYSRGITISMPVSADYAADTYAVNSDLISTVHDAANRAQAVVTEIAAGGYSDYEKLVAYRDRICAYTSYNDEAAASSSMAYGNPWQLIWVFDNDPNTTVVCEGYAKAFKYLCDKTSFSSSLTSCITVSGVMFDNTGGGDHMWNIVTMNDGLNYLADVTNCDEGSIGYPDKLFLAGYDYKEDDFEASYYDYAGNEFSYLTTLYGVQYNESSVEYYYYDTDTEDLCSDEALTIAGADYNPNETGNTTYLVTVTSEGDGISSTIAPVYGGGSYYKGDLATIGATNVSGFSFLGWYVSDTLVSTDLEYAFTVEGDIDLIAKYQANVETSFSLKITGYDFMVNGVPQNISYTEKFMAGTQVTLEYYGSDTFLRWENTANQPQSVNPTMTLTMNKNYELKVITVRKLNGSDASGYYAFVEFISPYDQVMSASTWSSKDNYTNHTLPSGVSKSGYSFAGWSMDGVNAAGAKDIINAINEYTPYIKLTALEVEMDAPRTVTVYDVNGNATEQEVNLGKNVSLKAGTVSGKTFKCWALDPEGTTPLSYNSSYTFKVTTNISVYAIYVNAGESVTPQPVVNTTGVFAETNETGDYLCFMENHDVPSGYTVEEYGILYGTKVSEFPDAATAEAKLFYDSENPYVLRATSPYTLKRDSFDLQFVVTGHRDNYVYTRSYLVVTNDATGEQEVYYGQFRYGTYNMLLGAEG